MTAGKRDRRFYTPDTMDRPITEQLDDLRAEIAAIRAILHTWSRQLEQLSAQVNNLTDDDESGYFTRPDVFSTEGI